MKQNQQTILSLVDNQISDLLNQQVQVIQEVKIFEQLDSASNLKIDANIHSIENIEEKLKEIRNEMSNGLSKNWSEGEVILKGALEKLQKTKENLEKTKDILRENQEQLLQDEYFVAKLERAHKHSSHKDIVKLTPEVREKFNIIQKSLDSQIEVQVNQIKELSEVINIAKSKNDFKETLKPLTNDLNKLKKDALDLVKIKSETYEIDGTKKLNINFKKLESNELAQKVNSIIIEKHQQKIQISSKEMPEHKEIISSNNKNPISEVRISQSVKSKITTQNLGAEKVGNLKPSLTPVQTNNLKSKGVKSL